jgi:site-specific DNA recombinase
MGSLAPVGLRTEVLSRWIEMQLESLIIPEVDAAKEAGELIHNLPKLWLEASSMERRKLILTMLDAVYIDAKKAKTIVAIKPKPPFLPILQVATSRAGADIRILNEPPNSSLKSSSVLLVETGEAGTLRYRSVFSLVKERRGLIVQFKN